MSQEGEAKESEIEFVSLCHTYETTIFFPPTFNIYLMYVGFGFRRRFERGRVGFSAPSYPPLQLAHIA